MSNISVTRTPPPDTPAPTPPPTPNSVMKDTTTAAAQPSSEADAKKEDAKLVAGKTPTVASQTEEIKPGEHMQPVQQSSPGYYYDRDQGAHVKLGEGKTIPEKGLTGEAMFEASRLAEEEARSKPPLLSKGPPSVSEDFASRAGDAMVKGVAENLTVAEEDRILTSTVQPDMPPPDSARRGAASSEDLR